MSSFKNIVTNKIFTYNSHTHTHTHIYIYIYIYEVLYFDLRPGQNAIQGDAPEGSDIFQWQLWEEIAWAEIG